MDFLFEIGLEEVPARMIAAAQAELQRRIVSLLERERLISAGTKGTSFSTPRRLAVLVENVAERQQDIAEEMLGPSTKIAYKDGQPTPAAIAFAKKAGVAVDALKTVTNVKGEYLAAASTKPGRTASEVIATDLPKELAAIYWAKNMYWRPGKPERFVRPVRWLVALLGGTVVPVEFGGYTASNLTYGHRVLHGPAPIILHAPMNYADALNNAYVMADVELRRHTIRKALDKVCRTIPETRWREDHALVDKLTHLIEWPSVIAGGFEPEYLELPEEVLVTVMRDHQSYFAVETKDSKLAPHFLAVLNTVASEQGEAVIRHGNERVLRARFNDARFFWEFDQRTPLVDRLPLLENVTFQKDLGSYADKSDRVRAISKTLADLVFERGVEVDRNTLSDAARLAKTDLTTELVKEFTELQGIIGGLYARAQNLVRAESVAMAIYDQYKPASMEDRIPRTVEGCLLGIADRTDTIAGMFGLGLEPTGSKDPFALRRAANSIVKILADSQIPLLLSEVVKVSASTPVIADKMSKFFAERLEFYLRDICGNAYDTVSAVVKAHKANANFPPEFANCDDVRDAVKRAAAVTDIRGSEDFLAVCAAFKRMKNILTQATENKDKISEFLPAFATTNEIRLWDEAQLAGAGFLADCKNQKYVEALSKLAGLRPIIDRYFDTIRVMDDDLEVRANRLGMIRFLTVNFAQIADFSEIVVAG